MKNFLETTAVKTINWRYRTTGSVDINVSEAPTKSYSSVMNWRYRLPNLNYEILTTVKSTSEMNWRYKNLENSPYDLN